MTQSIDVLSRTQRIIVDPVKQLQLKGGNRHISIVWGGPIGPPGLTVPAFAEGTQDFPSMTWIMDFNLGGKPAAFRFWDENGQEWEPEDIVYINPTRAIAQWPSPGMMGHWIAS